jgi:ABC-type transporter Mla subunit MlaD
MSLFGWMLVFVGLGLVALGVFALVALRLWRKIKSVGRDIATASEQLSALGSGGPRPR